MTQAAATLQQEIRVRITQELFPPYHDSHGTPNPMVQRRFTFEFPQGVAEVDQTDYGHPGKFNLVNVRRIPPALQPRYAQIVAAAEALAATLG